jgi:hypothetical protein
MYTGDRIMKDYKIGEEFEMGVRVRVERGTSCEHCAFRGMSHSACMELACQAINREDGQAVFFKAVEV